MFDQERPSAGGPLRMPTSPSDPRSHVWTRPQAWAVLGLAVSLILWSLVALYWPRGAATGTGPQGGKDLEAYRRIVERVHEGDDYYKAAGEELRARGYATSSVFNWRPPLYAWLLAAFPRPEWGQALLGLLALVALGLAYAAERQEGGVGRSLVLLLLMVGALLWCVDGDAFFAQELWAGVLIAVSVGSFGVRCRVGGIAAGLGALWLRELALPYVVVAVVLACRQKRWREAAVWCLGVACYGAFLAWHAGQVQQHLTAHELAEADGWIQFGGPAFVVRTSQMNVWLFNLPAWVAVFYLAAALVGLASWRGPQAFLVGATVGLYLASFLVVGKSFNAYWGLLYVALLPFGLVRAPAAFRALAATLRPPTVLGCPAPATYHDGKSMS
jgi:hypothetical protein